MISDRATASHAVADRLMASTSWLTLGTLGGVLLALVQTPILFRILTPSDFGLWAIGSAIASSIATLDFGLGAAASRFVALAATLSDWRGVARATSVSLAVAGSFIGLILTLAVLLEPVFASLIGKTYDGSVDPGTFYGVCIVAICANLLAVVARAAVTATSRFRLAGTVQCGAQVAVLAGSTAGALYGLSVPALLGIAAGGSAGQTLWMLILHYRRCRALARDMPPHFAGRLRLWELLRFSGWMQLNGVIGFLNSQTDRLVIASVQSAAAVGPFQVADAITRILRIVPGQVLIALLPRFTAALKKESQLVEEYNTGLQHIMRLTFFTAGLAVSVSPVAMQLWLGAVPPGLLWMLTILAVSTSVSMLTGPGTLVLRAAGRPGLETAYSACAAVGNVLLSILLGILYGSLGVVLATGISTGLASIGLLLIFPSRTGLTWLAETWRTLGRTCLPAVAVSAGLMILCSYVQSATSAIIPLALTMTAAAAAYVGVFALVDDRVRSGLTKWVAR